MKIAELVKKKRFIVIGSITLAITLAAVGIYFHKKKTSQPAGSDIVKVSRGDIEVRFRETGEIVPKTAVDVNAKVSGRILELYVHEGSRVKKGEKLALLQPGRSELDQYVPVVIAAPLDGLILVPDKKEDQQELPKFIQAGDYVLGLFESNSPTDLMTIADMREMAAELQISEMDILKLKEGLDVEVTVDAIAEEKFAGKIAAISPRAVKNNNNLKVFKVMIGLAKNDASHRNFNRPFPQGRGDARPAPHSFGDGVGAGGLGRLRAGMTARIEAVLNKKTNVLKIPLSVIYEEAGKETVYLADGKKSKRTEIKTGLKNEMDAEVLSGLKEGDNVLPEKPIEEK
ncbi:MAG: HlyD family efflux transporter periplasmic adaptor subunit [Elusimicrobia bacterium]|nr:HlyD family efflux transporter periplasmic adaptor subunit [Elusimicrobiota bacterium]